jgi:hypothetical protein
VSSASRTIVDSGALSVTGEIVLISQRRNPVRSEN